MYPHCIEGDYILHMECVGYEQKNRGKYMFPKSLPRIIAISTILQLTPQSSLYRMSSINDLQSWCKVQAHLFRLFLSILHVLNVIIQQNFLLCVICIR